MIERGHNAALRRTRQILLRRAQQRRLNLTGKVNISHGELFFRCSSSPIIVANAVSATNPENRPLSPTPPPRGGRGYEADRGGNSARPPGQRRDRAGIARTQPPSSTAGTALASRTALA